MTPLTPADDAALADLFARTADYWALERRTPSVAEVWAAPPEGFDPARTVRAGLWSGDRLDGLAEMDFGWPEPGDAYIGILLLAPEARGGGQGAALLAALTDHARAHGATRQLVAVLDNNPRGRAFWTREGFRPERTVPGEDGLIRHRMARPL